MSRGDTAVFLICLLSSSFAWSHRGPGDGHVPGPSYVAAVYEHRVVLNPEPHVTLSRDAALRHMGQNLDVYEAQAARAAQQGAQILVFPEDGIHGFNYSRSSISPYLETIPDPLVETWTPCTEPHRHNHTEVLQRLSCMARRHGLYLVANMADMQPCPPTPPPSSSFSSSPSPSPSPSSSSSSSSSSCPPDGRWQFNTNVVFSSEGLLVARYHKHNLYFERAYDQPPRLEVVTFHTPFAGTFGLLICFDLLFHDPTLALLERGVRQLVYPVAWMNQLPLLAAVQLQRAFSVGAGVSILSANVRSDALGMTGSAISSPAGGLHHHARHGDPEEGRLLVTRVPVLDPLWGGGEGGGEESGSSEPLDSQHCVSDDSSCQGALPPAPLPHPLPTSPSGPAPSDPFTSSMMHDPFTFVLLRGLEGERTVCDGALCCRLQYRRSPRGGSTELYALGAFAGTHTVNGRYALQVCALVRCAGVEPASCGQPVEEAESRVDFLLEGWFQTRHVYPSVLASRLVLEQPGRVERTAGGRAALRHSHMTAGLVTACLYGRMYHLDPE